MARRALVTGATGGLGRHLVCKLVSAGYTVRASGRNERVGRTLCNKHVDFVAGDLSDAPLVAILAQDADVIFHCAALSSPWGKRDEFIRSNIIVTQNLIEAAYSAGCKQFVHVSTPSLYFCFKDQLNICEDSDLPLQFVNHYAATKAEAERIVQKGASTRLKVSIVRPRGIFGEYDSVLVPRLLQIARNGRMPVFHNGAAIVDVTYAGNVADAMILCDGANTPPGTFNITNGEPVSVRDLLGRVFRTLDLNVKLVPTPYRPLAVLASGWEFTARALDLKTEPKLLRYTLGLMNYSQTLNISAAREKLGYTPKVSIDEGLRRFAAWYRLGASNGAGHEAS